MIWLDGSHYENQKANNNSRWLKLNGNSIKWKIVLAKLIDTIFDKNETITKCHLNNKEIGIILCKPGFMEGNTKTGACF